MTLEDLQHIFNPQIEAANIAGIPDMLVQFMLVDGTYQLIERHSMHKLEEVLPMLSSFQYAGSTNNTPIFIK